MVSKSDSQPLGPTLAERALNCSSMSRNLRAHMMSGVRRDGRNRQQLASGKRWQKHAKAAAEHFGTPADRMFNVCKSPLHFLPTAGYKCYRIYSLSTVKKVKTMVQYPGWTPKIACDPQVVSPIPSFLPQEFLLCDVACDGFNHGPAKLQRSWAANRFTRP